ncbi:hypothetical protein WA158_000781 [Blastocystis sp. Blastoise]
MSIDVPFGLIVPGLPLITSFQQADERKFITQLPSPSNILELGFFMNPNCQLPNYCVVLYYSFPPFQDWEVLATVTPNCPTAIFRTGWKAKNINNVELVQVGVSFEDSEFADNLKEAVPSTIESELPVMKIAQDCYNYVSSFGTSNGNTLILPSNIFDRWIERLKEKLNRDPTYYLKQ